MSRLALSEAERILRQAGYCTEREQVGLRVHFLAARWKTHTSYPTKLGVHPGAPGMESTVSGHSVIRLLNKVKK